MKNQEREVLILCDYGQVLANFDRSICAVEFERMLGRPMSPAGIQLTEELRLPFESGAIQAEEFLERTKKALALHTNAECNAFRQAWCSILWVQEDVVTLLREILQNAHTSLHVVTNTDPWRLEHASTTLHLQDFFSHATASFEAKVQPKAHNSSMWAKARRQASLRLGKSPDLVVGIDDVAQNLKAALADSTLDHGIVFQNVRQLERELYRLNIIPPPNSARDGVQRDAREKT